MQNLKVEILRTELTSNYIHLSNTNHPPQKFGIFNVLESSKIWVRDYEPAPDYEYLLFLLNSYVVVLKSMKRVVHRVWLDTASFKTVHKTKILFIVQFSNYD